MKKPEKMVGRMFDGDGAWEEGYNQACDDWEKYHEWYIKAHCVKKEDLPTVEEIVELLCPLMDCSLSVNECHNPEKCFLAKIAQVLAKRIGKERG